MGAWGVRVFENDAAVDWADGLAEVDDFSLVEAAFDEIEEAGDEYLEMDPACNALAACEVLARLLGHPGDRDSDTETVDQWVAKHKMKPSASLLERASRAIDRVTGQNSELRELWDESDEAEAWRNAVEDLRGRMRG